jgi:hypothetical protein
VVCRHREDFDLLGLRLLQIFHQCRHQLAEPASVTSFSRLTASPFKSNENLIVISLCWLCLVHRLPLLVGQDRRYPHAVDFTRTRRVKLQIVK